MKRVVIRVGLIFGILITGCKLSKVEVTKRKYFPGFYVSSINHYPSNIAKQPREEAIKPSLKEQIRVA